jgi:hypothetical protein
MAFCHGSLDLNATTTVKFVRMHDGFSFIAVYTTVKANPKSRDIRGELCNQRFLQSWISLSPFASMQEICKLLNILEFVTLLSPKRLIVLDVP